MLNITCAIFRVNQVTREDQRCIQAKQDAQRDGEEKTKSE